MRTNCWEFKKCGREIGGINVAELGICPATTASKANGYCEGENGGRGCAFIAGTFCGGAIQGTVADKEKNCSNCDFYKDLRREHGINFNVIAFGRYIRG